MHSIHTSRSEARKPMWALIWLSNHLLIKQGQRTGSCTVETAAASFHGDVFVSSLVVFRLIQLRFSGLSLEALTHDSWLDNVETMRPDQNHKAVGQTANEAELFKRHQTPTDTLSRCFHKSWQLDGFRASPDFKSWWKMDSSTCWFCASLDRPKPCLWSGSLLIAHGHCKSLFWNTADFYKSLFWTGWKPNLPNSKKSARSTLQQRNLNSWVVFF